MVFHNYQLIVNELLKAPVCCLLSRNYKLKKTPHDIPTYPGLYQIDLNDNFSINFAIGFVGEENLINSLTHTIPHLVLVVKERIEI